MGAIRAGLVFQLKAAITPELIMDRERQLFRWVVLAFASHARIGGGGPSKNSVSLTQNVGFYFRNLKIAAFCILMSYFMENKLKKISIDSW